MVHVCQTERELVDPSTQSVDTLCVIGTVKAFGDDIAWVMDTVLPVALRAQKGRTPTDIMASTVEVDAMTSKVSPSEPSAAKKVKLSSDYVGGEDTKAVIKQAQFLVMTILDNLMATTSPSQCVPVSTEVWVPRTLASGTAEAASSTKDLFSSSSSPSPPSLLLVVLVVLPATSTLSRHNSPGQPANFTAMLKKHVRVSESTAIVALSERPEDARSTVCAVARVSGGLLYNRKTSQTTLTMTSVVSAGNQVTDPHHGQHHHSSSPLVLPAGGMAGTFVQETSLPSLNHLRVLLGPKAPVDALLQQELATLALGIQLTRRLVDAPCSELHTTAFKEQALAICQGLQQSLQKVQAGGAGSGKITTKVIEGEDLLRQGFGGLYGVGKAAVHPPALIMLTYTPSTVGDPDSTKSIAMVGKGIVFDTGGLQIKNKPGMCGMKRDMGGAAAILSAFGARVRSQNPPNRPLHAVLCLAENSVASHATRADDILYMYSGKTVEINNTDAEGRLVLGDGVAAAIRHLNPGVIIDMATLTGAQGVATGKHFGALYCNDEKLEKVAIEAGRMSGDLCHPMPYAPEFFKSEYSSAVAGNATFNMKNSVADRSNAQVSCAGQFIGNHMGDWLEKGGQWCHIDMAYPAFDKKDERATGYGVALLYSMLELLG